MTQITTQRQGEMVMRRNLSCSGKSTFPLFSPLRSGQILNADNVQTIRGGYRVIFSHDDDDICANHDEVLMRHTQAFPTGEFDDKWLETIGQPFPNAVQIHVFSIASEAG